MILSESTLKVLKNFSTINPSIMFRAGSELSTQSIAGNIVAESHVEEEFPVEFCLYDLVEFLNTLKLFKSPVLDFSEANNNYMYICEENNLGFKVRYTFSEKKLITYPLKRPQMPPTDVNFVLDVKTLESISKAANVMQLPNLTILPSIDDGKIQIEVSDIKDRSSNKFSITIDGESPDGVEFNLIFNMDTFKMVPNTYNVGIAKNSVASFLSDSIDYYIGLDSKSKFGE